MFLQIANNVLYFLGGAVTLCCVACIFGGADNDR